MSGTRRAKNDSGFYQNRYASSAEYERGLLANLVARRVSMLDDPADRDLIWFIQFLSHTERGLMGLLDDLAEKHPTRLEEKVVVEHFLTEKPREETEGYLKKLCLDPATEIKDPYCFPNLIKTLREYRKAYIKSKSTSFTTALGKKVYEVLDYTDFSRGLTLMEGEARTGKTFAARAWCEQHPGEARFIEVPAGNDDSGFFRSLARGLGLGNFLQYKACEIRERVESVLLTGDLILVLDEAQRLWPQQNLRYGFPRRIVWVMAMANQDVPIAMVSTPQFIAIQKAVEKSGWNSTQFTGRIKHYEPLPMDLSQADLIAVAKSVLPEADSLVLRALAVYARSSARYLAAIDSISTRARYLAMKDGRHAATTADVRKAMQESVIPADNKLQAALELGRKSKSPALSAGGGRPSESGLDFSPEETSRPGQAHSAPRRRSLETPLVVG